MKKITLHNIKNFFQSYLNMFITWLNKVNWRKEQYEWRENRVKIISPKCLEGKCIHCGCKTPDKFFEPDACENGCYPEWMNEDQWRVYIKTEEDLKESNKANKFKKYKK